MNKCRFIIWLHFKIELSNYKICKPWQSITTRWSHKIHLGNDEFEIYFSTRRRLMQTIALFVWCHHSMSIRPKLICMVPSHLCEKIVLALRSLMTSTSFLKYPSWDMIRSTQVAKSFPEWSQRHWLITILSFDDVEFTPDTSPFHCMSKFIH